MKFRSNGNPGREYIMLEDGNLFLVKESVRKIKHRNLSPGFFSFVQKNLPTADTQHYSKPVDVSRIKMFTFLAINTGLNPVILQPEISPDKISWHDYNDPEVTVPPGDMQVITPNYFLRFTRLKFKNLNPGFNSVVTIWFQGQC